MKIGHKINPILFALLLAFTFQACDTDRVYEKNVEIENGRWQDENTIEYGFEIENTDQLYNLMINVRNKNDYPYSNLFLFVEMTSPDNKYYSDTLEFILADKTGQWTGSGIGNIWQNQFSIFEGVKMLIPGEYKVKIGHGMREDSLKGISDVGIRVEINE